MQDDSYDPDISLDLIAEMRGLVEETHQAIAMTQEILERCTTGERRGEKPKRPPPDTLDTLAEGLIHVHALAKQDGDPKSVALVEQALLHVGRRLARNLSPAEQRRARH